MIVGNGVSGVIVWTPAPGIANWIVCGPAVEFASRMACRSEPAPESLVFVTVNVAAAREEETQKSAQSDTGAHGDESSVYGRRSALTRNVAICPRLFGFDGQ